MRYVINLLWFTPCTGSKDGLENEGQDRETAFSCIPLRRGISIYNRVFVWAFFVHADFHSLDTKINKQTLSSLCAQRTHFQKSGLVTQPVEVKINK